MIEKMKYVNIMGHINDFDRVVEQYIGKYDIHLENAVKELSDTMGVFPFATANPYAAIYKEAERLHDALGIKDGFFYKMDKENALSILQMASEFFQNKDVELAALEERRNLLNDFALKVEPFTGLEFDVEALEQFEFIKLRFGRMPYGSYKQFETFLHSNPNILFVDAKRTEYVYGMYFVPAESSDRADSLLSSFHFERIWISFDIDGEKQRGSFKKIYNETLTKINGLDAKIRELRREGLSGLSISNRKFLSAFNTIKELHACFEARKYAAKTKHDFYIFVGWMTEKECNLFQKEVANDDLVVVTVEDGADMQNVRPPTLLSNPFFARPFEFFVKMYGLPSYCEMDPTLFVALTYTLLFGIMFGDLGQGAVLTLAGLYMRKARGMQLGSILGIIGISSMIFGALYGSVFGFENILPALWTKPTENINNILFIAVGIGIVFILTVMIFNIRNSVSQKDPGKLLFSPHGVAGVCFYGSLIYLVLMLALKVTPALEKVLLPVLVILMAISIALIAFHEPLSNLLRGMPAGEYSARRKLIRTGVGQFLLETFIELFEVLLSYFTNTVSFVRVGAFALSHAGMMSVIMTLSGSGSRHNWLVIVLGNILVIALEGLVVGIQVLRLEFYEMFSRFFEGNGRPFLPFNR
ncbi:MAG: ATPase [Clostridiales bacterium]|jgi:V/A-type H+-transporting ATPase subunit I|nr:ATPase [Clostridiales bacterium]